MPRHGRRVPMPPPAHKSSDDWALVCTLCEFEWSETVKLDVVELHYSIEHPGEKMNFTTQWRGKGPAPQRQEPNRAQRRRQAKKKGQKR